MVGVTGTNGKTSCAQWIAAALDACGRRAAVIGTLGNGLSGALDAATHTTPDAARAARAARASSGGRGADAVAMEVSSHGLDQGRVNGVSLRRRAVHQPHARPPRLSRHDGGLRRGEGEALRVAGLRTAVVNADDPFGQSLIDAARGSGARQVLTYGFGAADIGGDAHDRDRRSGHCLRRRQRRGARARSSAPLVGAFNAPNLLGVLGALLASGVALDAALRPRRAR